MALAELIRRVAGGRVSGAAEVDALLSKAEATRSDRRRRSLLLQAASVLESLEDQGGVLEILGALLADDPNDAELDPRYRRLCRDLGRFSELIAHLERRAARAEPTEASAMRRDAARLCAQELGDLERAIAMHLELRRDGSWNGGDREALRQVYERARRWEDAIALWREELSECDGERRVAIHLRLGELYRRELLEPARALTEFGEALARMPGNRDAFEAACSLIGEAPHIALEVAAVLEAACDADDDAWRIAAALEQAAEDCLDVAVRAALLRHAGQLYDRRLRCARQAFDALSRALAEDADDEPLLTHLQRLGAELGAWRELAELEAWVAEQCSSPERRRLLLLSAGQLFEEEARAPRRAMTAYRNALAAVPQDRDAMWSLARLYEQEQQWADLATLLERRLEAAQEPMERRELELRLAEVLVEHLEEVDDGLACLTRLLADERAEGHVLAMFEDLWQRGCRRREVADALEAAYTETQRWELLEALYREQLAGDPDEPMILRKIALVCERRGELAAAAAAYRQVILCGGNQSESVTALERLCGSDEDALELLDVLSELLPRAKSDAEVAVCELRRGRLYERWLGDRDKARSSYEAVLDKDGRNLEALEALERLHLRSEDWRALVALYEQRLRSTEDAEERAELHLRAAEVYGQAVLDESLALDHCKQALAARPRDCRALELRCMLAWRAGRVTDLVLALEALCAATDGPGAKARLLRQIAAAQVRGCGDALAAADALERSLEHQEDRGALEALLDHYRSEADGSAHAETLWRLLRLPDEPIARAGERFRELAELEERCGRLDRAVAACQRRYELDRDDAAAQELARLLAAARRWPECAALLEDHASWTQEPALRHQLQLELAVVYRSELGQLDRAALLCKSLSGDDALDELERIYRAAERWRDLLQLLRARAAKRPQDRVALLSQAAALAQAELGEPLLALEIWLDVVRADARQQEAAAQLAQLAHVLGAWHRLLEELLEHVQELTASDAHEQAAALWTLLGRWYLVELDDAESARTAAAHALASQPYEHAAWDLSIAAHRRAQAWGTLAETLVDAIEVANDEARQVSLYTQLGALSREHLSDDELHRWAHERALTLDPHHLPSLLALQPVCRAAEAWRELESVLRRLIENGTDDHASAWLLELATVSEDHLGSPTEALAAYRQVLAIAPHSTVAQVAAERLGQRVGDLAAVAQSLSLQLAAANDDGARISLCERLARVSERAGAIAEAAAAWERLLELAPERYELYPELVRLYRRLERWDELARVYRRQLANDDDEEVRIARLIELGEVLERGAGDVDAAVASYEEALAFAPSSGAAWAALGRACERAERWSRAASALEHALEFTAEAERGPLHFALGRVIIRGGHDRDAESHLLCAARLLDTAEPRLELAALYEGRGMWAQTAMWLEQAAERTHSAIEAPGLWHRAGRIHLDRLGRTDDGTRCMASAFALEPSMIDAAQSLAELYDEASRWDELAPVMEVVIRHLRHAAPDAAKRAVQCERAGRCAAARGEHASAKRFFLEAREIAASPAVLLGLAEANFATGEFHAAVAGYRAYLGASSTASADLYCRLGVALANTGERDRGIEVLAQALALEPNHYEALVATSELCAAAGDAAAAIEAKRSLAQLSEGAVAAQVFEDIGQLAADVLGDSREALDAYFQALELTPGNHRRLQRALELCAELGEWEMAIDVIDRFVACEPDAVRCGSYHQAAAAILRDELGEPKAATERFECALASFFADPGKLTDAMVTRAMQAFVDIDALLTEARDWSGQERAYRAMIQRLPKGHPALASLWDSLGEIYRTRLARLSDAIDAFEVAQHLDPKGSERREILAELYVIAGADQVDKAVAQHRDLLRDDPLHAQSYRDLGRIYLDAGGEEQAWCVFRALVATGRAAAVEKSFVERRQARFGHNGPSELLPQYWAHIRHQDEDPHLGAVMAAVWRAAAVVADRALARAPSTSDATPLSPLHRVLREVARAVGVAAPPVLLDGGFRDPVFLTYATSRSGPTPALIAAPDAGRGESPAWLTFAFARELARARPEYLATVAIPGVAELRAAVVAAIATACPDVPIPKREHALAAPYAQAFASGLRGDERRHLQFAVRELLRAEVADVASWSRAVDATVTRAAFVVCEDLHAALRVLLGRAVLDATRLAQNHPARDLLSYAISDDYFAVRSERARAVAA